MILSTFNGFDALGETSVLACPTAATDWAFFTASFSRKAFLSSFTLASAASRSVLSSANRFSVSRSLASSSLFFSLCQKLRNKVSETQSSAQDDR